MVVGEPIHIDHTLPNQLCHQAQYPIMVTIFLSPYINRLARGLGMIDHYTGMRQLGAMRLLEVTTSRAMSMIEMQDTSHEV